MKKYRDHYFEKAKKEHYPARSIYKLDEIDAKFSLLKPGAKILELGAAPGSWTMYAAKRAGSRGTIIAIDLKEARAALPGNVQWFVDDVLHPGEALSQALAATRPFDLLLSDMAPATSGITFTDQARSFELAEQALNLAKLYLAEGGSFAVKIFMGPDVEILLKEMRRCFSAVKGFKPKSSRSESKETFYIGRGFISP